MSKFQPIMHLLDLKNFEIKDSEFSPNIRYFQKQQVCKIPLKLCELNPLCSKCMFADVVTTQGKVNELGVSGYMSNQEDGLKPITNNPKTGVTLRDPATIIIAAGQVWACKNKKQTTDNFLLTEREPSCEFFKEKTTQKKAR